MIERTFARPLEAVESLEHGFDETGLIITAEKVVRADDPYMSGHFPGLTLYPAVFLLEGIRQAVGSVVDKPLELGTIRSLRILKPMLNGDRLVLRIAVSSSETPGILRTDLRCLRAGGPAVAQISAELIECGA
jgi:3-hydroxymyristoyl/3-hydroxydecanoyl-(acyl carrier protein) dehydratase